MDLSKSFGSIKHDILLTKVTKIGIQWVSLKLFESYLSNRKQ